MLNKYIRLNPEYKFYISFDGGKAEHFCEPLKKYKMNKAACEIMSYLKTEKPMVVEKILNDYLSKINKRTTGNLQILRKYLINMQNIGLISFVQSYVQNENIYGSTSSCYPRKMAIELTNDCNSSCIHCYFDPSKSKVIKIDAEQLLARLISLKNTRLHHIELTGGEPVMHPDFFKILSFSIQNFKFLSIMTNGTLIDGKFIEKIKKIDKSKRHFIFFSISLDADTKELYKTIRRIDGFVKVKNAIKLLRKNDFFVRATMTILPKFNINHIYNTFKLATEELDVNFFSYTPVIPFGKSLNPWTGPDITTLFKIIKDQENLIKKDKLSTRLENGSGIPFKEAINCGAGYEKIAISCTGNIKPCTLFPDNFVTLGNFFQDELDNIFEYNNLKDFINISSPRKSFCSHCNHYQKFCEGCILNGLVSYNSFKSCNWVKQLPKSFLNKLKFKHCEKL